MITYYTHLTFIHLFLTSSQWPVVDMKQCQVLGPIFIILLNLWLAQAVNVSLDFFRQLLHVVCNIASRPMTHSGGN